jgi:hypothetical protein
MFMPICKSGFQEAESGLLNVSTDGRTGPKKPSKQWLVTQTRYFAHSEETAKQN